MTTEPGKLTTTEPGKLTTSLPSRAATSLTAHCPSTLGQRIITPNETQGMFEWDPTYEQELN